MKSLAATLVSGTLLFLSFAPALAADDPAAPPAQAPAEANAPPSAPPAEIPPAPPPQTPAPPSEAQPPAAPSVPAGQWVYTSQYGWVWMPYSEAYTHVPPDGYGTPYAYVYYPAYGWTWLVAPWIWGWGPWPYFGAFGPWRFAWYGFGWWRFPSRWHFAPAAFPHGFGFHGVRPAPPRASFGMGAGRVGGFRGGAVLGGPGVRGGGGGRMGGHMGGRR